MDTKAGRKDADTAVPALLRFLDFTLDPGRQLLIRGTEQIRLRPRTYDVLAYLVTHAGRLVGKTELMDAVWKDVAVTDDSLVQCLMEIRRALGDEHGVVKTVRGRGYLLDADVTRISEAHAGGNEAVRVIPRLARFRAVLAASTLVVVAIAAAVWWTSFRHARDVSASAPTTPIRSLAVLPLENLSGNPEQDYFADGMTDELITELARISAIRVISRTSVMRFKGTRKPLAEIVRELDVDAVVAGAVVRSPDRVRVTAQLIQAHPEKSLWTDRYERPLGDVVILQGQLAREISEALRVTLTPQERTGLTSVRPVDPEAHEAFLKGRYYWGRRTEQTTIKAIGYFQQAIEKDPRYARAFAGLADSEISLALSEALQEVVPPKEAFPKARAAVNRALEIDDTLAEAHASLGHIKFQYDRDWPGAEREFKRAIALNPNYADAHHWYALSLVWTGRHEEALDQISRARKLDPLSLVINANLGFILGIVQESERGIEQCRKTLDMDPTFALAHYRLGQILILRRRPADAIEELKQAVVLSGSPRATAELGLAYALLGNRREALRQLADLIERAKRRHVSPFNLAVIYGGLGETDRTLDLLEAAYDEGSPSLNLLQLSPAFTSIRSDPRFTALVHRLGLAARP